jgi:hypothetical protein
LKRAPELVASQRRCRHGRTATVQRIAAAGTRETPHNKKTKGVDLVVAGRSVRVAQRDRKHNEVSFRTAGRETRLEFGKRSQTHNRTWR